MREMKFGRRSLLSAAGMIVAGSVAACSAPQPNRPPQPQPLPRPPMPPVASHSGPPLVNVETVYSEHRGADTSLMIAHPNGLQDTANLPMALFLHGRDAMNPSPIPWGVLDALQPEFDAGNIPPFGLVAVDGGFNSYWNDGSANGDLMSMLLQEVPGWLRERGLAGQDGLPFACGGVSTGGFGALNYAAERNMAGSPLAAVATIAPALPVTWQHMQEKGVFASEQEWIETDPLRRVDELGDVPVGIWIGEFDVFREGTDQLAQLYPNTPVYSVVPGGHEGPVFDSVGVDAVGFLAGGFPAEG